MKQIADKKGFTLIELLVVIAIIGVLSTLAIVALGSARQKSRDAKRLADLNQVAKALELYFSDNNGYPTVITPGQPLKSPDGLTTYMAVLPTNPTPRNEGTCPNSDYVYTADSSGLDYSFSTCLGTSATSSASTNSSVVSASSTGIFSCGQKASDVDGNQYDTIQIGSQCWMKQNLNVGTRVNGSGGQVNDSLIEKYCMSDVAGNCTTYGGLYQWAEAMNLPSSCLTADCSAQIQTPHKGICPSGWHVPTHVEMNTLEQSTVQAIASSATQYVCDAASSGYRRCADDSGTDIGGTKGAGKSLKKIGVGSGVGAGDDLVGFSLVLPGIRNLPSGFSSIGNASYLWQAIQSTATTASVRYFDTPSSVVWRGASNKSYGFSLRCVKNY